jgi:hypothetical protein
MNTKPDPGINSALCPLCGEPNQCAMAADPDAKECWCGNKKFPRDLLAQIPDKAVRRVCICEKCLEEFLAESDSSDVP